MSNQQKSEFVIGNFGIQSFWGGYGEILLKSWFRPNSRVCLEFWFIKLVEFPTAITHKWLTVWGCIMDHQKAERVFYRNGIWDFWSFGQSDAQKLSSVQPLFCPETESSNKVDLQNCITSQPLSGKSRVSNGWKSGRVFQVFCIQLKRTIPPKQSQIWFFFHHCNLSGTTVSATRRISKRHIV
jgi:hypothetical protein